LKLLARLLEVPQYVLNEHILQLGTSEVLEIMKNDALKENLQRHLVQEHLLVSATEIEPPSDAALKAKNAVEFLQTVELLADNSEAVVSFMDKLTHEAIMTAKQKTKVEAKPIGLT
jgi:hypothetical protein